MTARPDQLAARRHRDDLVYYLHDALVGMTIEAARQMPLPGFWEAQVYADGVQVDVRDHVRVSRALLELFRTTQAAFRARDRQKRTRESAHLATEPADIPAQPDAAPVAGFVTGEGGIAGPAANSAPGPRAA